MRRYLGISFCSNNIHFTELAGDSGAARLENVESVKVDFDFEDEFSRHKSSQKDLTNISGEITSYIARRNLPVTSASLSIGTSQAFLITLPIDYSEGRHAVNTKIYWELSNYFPDNYNDFLINTYRLNSTLPTVGSDEFLIIAVKKNTIEFIRRIFKVSNLALSVVDIDHFSAEHSMRLSGGGKLDGKKVLLVGLKKNRIDYGYLENKKYRYYSYSKYNSDAEFNLSLTRKLGQLFTKEPVSGGVDAIYLYGEDIREDTLDAVRKLDKAPIEVINPFESVEASELFLKDENLRKNSYKYAASLGVALRSIAKN